MTRMSDADRRDAAESVPIAPPKRILVVDDDQDSAETLAELLTCQGHDARFALDGARALALAKEFLPDVVLLDIEMVGMSGNEVARLLRLEPSLAGVLLVAVTGWSGLEQETKAREAGFDHYLVKPVDEDVLSRVL